jgi:hypothetical protein
MAGMRGLVWLAACLALGGVAITGCGPTISAAADGPTGSATATASAGATGTSTPTAGQATASALASAPVAVSGPPSYWAPWLGKHVLIEAPTAEPGQDTPQWVVVAYVKHLVSADGGSACDYLVPKASDFCVRGYFADLWQDDNVTYSYTSFQLGYTAVYDGNKALVGTVRTGLCDQPMHSNCLPDNTNPAALLNTRQSFAALWQGAHNPGPGYELTPLVKQNGTWYIDTAAILGG